MSGFLLFFSAVTVAFLSGCASTNFAKTAESATITEQRIPIAPSSHLWGINKLVQVGDTKLGYYGSRRAKSYDPNSGATYTIDAGPTAIAVWYYDNQTGNHLVNQSPITKMQLKLKPQGRYELRSVKKDDKLQFMVIDLDAGASVVTSNWVNLQQQPLPEGLEESGTLALPGLLRMIK